MYVQRCSEVMRYNHLPHNQAIKAKTTTTPIMDDNIFFYGRFCFVEHTEMKELSKESIREETEKGNSEIYKIQSIRRRLYFNVHTSSSHYKTDIK